MVYVCHKAEKFELILKCLKLATVQLAYIEVHFDFIECFTTTFLRTHSWLNWVEYIEVQGT